MILKTLKAAASNMTVKEWEALEGLLSSWGAEQSCMFDYEQLEGTWVIQNDNWELTTKENAVPLTTEPYVEHKPLYIEGFNEGSIVSLSADGLCVFIEGTILDIHNHPEIVWTLRHVLLKENWISKIESRMEDVAGDMEDNRGLQTTRSIDDESWLWIPQHPPFKKRLLAGYDTPTDEEIETASVEFFKPIT